MTIHDPSLRTALKTLKLTGMLDTLDARLAQTRDGKLGHLEFLQVLPGSSNAHACSPTSLVDTPTAPSVNACANTPDLSY